MKRPNFIDLFLFKSDDLTWKAARAAALVLCVFFLGWASASLFSGNSSPVLQLKFQTSADGKLVLYFDLGHGFRGEDSVTVPVAAGETQSIELPLPRAVIHTLRIDPLEGPGSILISGIKVILPGRADLDLPLSRLTADNQIESLRVDAEGAHFRTTSDAFDPYLVFRPAASIDTRPPRLSAQHIGAVLSWSAIWAFIVVSAALLTPALFRWGTTRRRTLIVACAAVIGTLIACAPIVFDNRSLLSPSNGGTLFYDSCPTVPSPYDCRPENVRGADVGAMAWQWFPYAVAQERALKLWGEIPLWNRYNANASSLIGQLQSMLGDPIMWLQWIIGVDTWNFDAKFVALRLLFAICVGLSVLTVTRSVIAAAMASFMAPFIGFFIYRVSHAAIFALCYGSLLTLAWLRITYASSDRARFLWVASLPAINWLVLNSGTAKEAFVVLISLNAIGAVHFLLEGRKQRSFALFSGMLIVSGIAFVLISAPIWATFLQALKSAFTLSSVAVAQGRTYNALVLIDTYFNAVVSNTYFVALHSAFAVGFFAALVSLPTFRKGRMRTSALVFSGGSLLLFGIAFGIVPEQLLAHIPLIQQIGHVHNTFATAMIVPACVLAGIGFAAIDHLVKTRSETVLLMVVALILFAVTATFIASRALSPTQIRNIIVYSLIVFTAALFLPGLMAALARGRLNYLGTALCIAFGAIVLARGAAYSDAGARHDFFEPGERVSTVGIPNVVSQVQKHILSDPARVVGVGHVLFPGYNASLGLEAINGPDALTVKRYRELTDALRMPYVWQWRLEFTPESIRANDRALDLLGVRYLFASVPIRDFPLITKDARVGVYERTTAWPRAFFVDRAELAKDLPALAARIRQGNSTPFVAIESDVKNETLAELVGTEPARTIVKARDYVLTNNTTSFTIDAPSAGIVYLGETDIPGDFEARLDGRPVPYFVANHAFKAIVIPAAGTYRVSFAYWPCHFSALLIVGLIGLIAWCGAMFFFWRRLRNLPRPAHCAETI